MSRTLKLCGSERNRARNIARDKFGSHGEKPLHTKPKPKTENCRELQREICTQLSAIDRKRSTTVGCLSRNARYGIFLRKRAVT